MIERKGTGKREVGSKKEQKEKETGKRKERRTERKGNRKKENGKKEEQKEKETGKREIEGNKGRKTGDRGSS